MEGIQNNKNNVLLHATYGLSHTQVSLCSLKCGNLIKGAGIWIFASIVHAGQSMIPVAKNPESSLPVSLKCLVCMMGEGRLVALSLQCPCSTPHVDSIFGVPNLKPTALQVDLP